MLRDRVVRLPDTSRRTLWRLKETIEYLQTHHSVATAASTSHHLLYRVLAELAMSRECQQGMAQRSQHSMTLVMQELILLIARETQQLVTAPSRITSQRAIGSDHGHN